MNDERRHFATKEEFDKFRDDIHEPYIWSFGEWSFDWIDRIVEPGHVYLGPRQADVLRVLCESLTMPLSSVEIAIRVAVITGSDVGPDEIKTVVHRIRGKLGASLIWSAGNRGYLLVPFEKRTQ